MVESLTLANTLYRICYVLGFALTFVFNAVYARHYRIKAGKAFLFSLVSYLLIFGWSYVLAWVFNGFRWGHHNAIRVYIWFPAVLFVTAKLFRVDFKDSCEFFTPSTCIVYGIARLGCIFPGCCYGIPMEHGMYSYAADCRCFPVQLCEALTSLLIAVVMVILARKKHFDSRENTLYPTMLVLYGGTRFIWEFFSASKRVLWNVTELGLWALATCVMGCVWLLLHAKNKGKAPEKR